MEMVWVMCLSNGGGVSSNSSAAKATFGANGQELTFRPAKGKGALQVLPDDSLCPVLHSCLKGARSSITVSKGTTDCLVCCAPARCKCKSPDQSPRSLRNYPDTSSAFLVQPFRQLFSMLAAGHIMPPRNCFSLLSGFTCPTPTAKTWTT